MSDDLEYLRVVGVSHYQDAVARCSAGEAVRFIHEPDNPHDRMAIRVISVLGETIGYAPRKSWIHHAIHEQGRGVSAIIHSVGFSRSCLLGVLLSAAVCDDEVAVASYFPGCAAPERPPGGFRYWINTPADVARLVATRK